MGEKDNERLMKELCTIVKTPQYWTGWDEKRRDARQQVRVQRKQA